ncbi:hypothetical protein OsJ_31368 [Oryza sativa Japonica Group]|uniref:Xylanase inhibitor C-terminal domain-containing protein n=1 Tax=Oryza sativa subsp. japonica TaxID=39947 RepID=B9G5J2_ORYSJ|nr:hypothetical protein OsJ_31368 [Oryza sativa Japonica Group]
MARRRRRGCGASASTSTPLIPVGVDKAPNIDPNLYFVAITGIKVASGEIVSDKAAAIMTTVSTLYTFLNPVLFDHLKKQLPPLADKGSSVLCYTKDTELPAITLVFAGKDAAMKLAPEHYSYKRSDGAVCLSILRSPLHGGVFVIGRRGGPRIFKLGYSKLEEEEKNFQPKGARALLRGILLITGIRSGIEKTNMAS